MAKQPNIIPFEQARTPSSARNSKQARQTRFDEAEGSSRRSAKRSERRDSTADRDSSRASSRRSNRQMAESRETGNRSRRTGRSAAQVDERQSNSKSRRRGNVAVSQEVASEEARSLRSSQDQPRSKREERRRERSKTRAERLFAKQYESDRPATVENDANAPRAALYEGKMGASHRKSTRMQRASSATPQTAKLNPAGWLSNLQVSPRTLKGFTAVLCVVLIAVFLYVPAQQYYQAQREHDRLVAEYAVLEQRNAALNSQNDSLSSNAGMEDAVRQKYGYVVEGDQAGYVVGLSDNATDTSRDSENIEANVLSSAVKAPEEWYTPYLDAFFGVS